MEAVDEVLGNIVLLEGAHVFEDRHFVLHGFSCPLMSLYPLRVRVKSENYSPPGISAFYFSIVYLLLAKARGTYFQNYGALRSFSTFGKSLIMRRPLDVGDLFDMARVMA